VQSQHFSIYELKECVPEILEAKQAVFSQLDELVSPSTVLASSTSNICPSLFTGHIKNKQNAIVRIFLMCAPFSRLAYMSLVRWRTQSTRRT
jgi:3-hydroxyacyl-CoA dehydrogenase